MSNGDDTRRGPTMPEDPELSRLYRGGPPEQPPRALDEAIRAAARREVSARPRAAPAGRRAWQIPLSVAAVLVLSVTLTLMLREQEPAVLAPAPALPSAAKKALPSLAPAASPPAGPTKLAPERSPVREREERAFPAPAKPVAEPPARDVSPDAGVPVQRPLPGGFAAKPAESKVQTESAGRPAAAASPAPVTKEAESAAQSGRVSKRGDAQDAQKLAPEEWLQRIRELRREGRLAEAEASLAEFRKRYPGYALPEDLRDASNGAGDRR